MLKVERELEVLKKETQRVSCVYSGDQSKVGYVLVAGCTCVVSDWAVEELCEDETETLKDSSGNRCRVNMEGG